MPAPICMRCLYFQNAIRVSDAVLPEILEIVWGRCYIKSIKGTTAHKVVRPRLKSRNSTLSLGQSFGVVFLCAVTY